MKEKSFKRKNELIEGALDEFITKSYEDASLNNIIKDAGISKGTFYYHFKDKKALYLSLIESTNKVKREFMNKRMKERAEDFKGKDIFERFKLQTQIEIEFAIEFPQYQKLLMMFSKEEGNKIYEYVRGVLENNEKLLLEEMIKKAIKEGNFNNRFSKDFIMKIMSYPFLNFNEILNIKDDDDMEKILESINDYVDFMKYGLGKDVTRSDWVRTISYLIVYCTVVILGAIFLIPSYWYLWTIILIAGLILLVQWHAKSSFYRCPKCGGEFQVSFITDLISPQGVGRTEDGKTYGWKYLKCPACKKRRKAVLVKMEPISFEKPIKNS